MYIHGHSAGGTNPSLVEMMHFGVPIFCFDCSFNRFSTDYECDYFVDAEHLVKLVEATPLEQLKANGISMKRIAVQRYTWAKIAKEYESCY